MRYRYLYLDQIVDMIEGSTDPAVKMAVSWANQDQPNLYSLLHLLYDFRWNFEIGGVPKYRRNRNGGMEFHAAVTMLNNKINGRPIPATTKFKHLINILEKMQDRDAEVLIAALRHQINFRIPLEDIQRAFPMIQAGPNFANKAPKLKTLSNLECPATIVHQVPGPEIRVVINENGNFKFVDQKGHGLIFPNKPMSAFNEIFKGLRNITMSCVFHGLTKDKTKIGNTATSNASFAKFQAGELEDETLAVTVLDCVDNWSYMNYPELRETANMGFAARREWLENHPFPESIHLRLADVTKVEDLAALRKQENLVATSKDVLRVYSDNATWADGYHVLIKEAF